MAKSGSDRGPFWSVFENSQIPMALVDSHRRYVAVNDAAVELYQYRREEMLGELAGRKTYPDDPATGDAEWETLRRTNELYGERVVEHGTGAPMRVSYAAHTTKVKGRWLALFVTLSAHLEPGGAELIAAASPEVPSARSKALTPREREVVRLVALGRSTRQIAADMYLSPATVRSHVRNAMVKTGAHTRAQLVAIALGEGLVSK
jgi:PAS domain S-box-containing protein